MLCRYKIKEKEDEIEKIFKELELLKSLDIKKKNILFS